MIELASQKMPDAHLYQGDFSEGLAEPLLKQRYDFILATNLLADSSGFDGLTF